ncbi:hypothetical protein COT78_01165 [Candidatus Berkelbacteria bacterium CG10_big_fil_rev_8_21_14_0_10_43_13]|uniref:Prepilin-type N-terminal cleavage/methylation domain-containing protein n=1 Tax=Candidatus Berkelbacteria bacterium CG10_big_fil_rev_8_21_14_0_10_43_13 TaxID=1974514 RepID=A0A2H0W6X8_9BACT|nr:MAG: hypothetical protein COT78_01165 [Candidatus Berkelbacteria bacterium CG10_big_fil_rev_8_21_14_0_10_43_13]
MKIIRTNQFGKAFTLLEVLIATSIFAVVMIMTTGVISQSTAYQTKTKTLRDASEETARIADAISRDLKAASGSFTLFDKSNNHHLMKNGVAMLDTDGKFLTTLKTQLAAPNDVDNFTTYPASVLIINLESAGAFRIYYSKPGTPSVIYAKTYDKASSEFGKWYSKVASDETLKIVSTAPGNPNLLVKNLIVSTNNNQISTFEGDNKLDTSAGFTGYTATDIGTAPHAQSYINFYVHSRTDGYASLPPTNRAESYLRSMVTMRNYAN